MHDEAPTGGPPSGVPFSLYTDSDSRSPADDASPSLADADASHAQPAPAGSAQAAHPGAPAPAPPPERTSRHAHHRRWLIGAIIAVLVVLLIVYFIHRRSVAAQKAAAAARPAPAAITAGESQTGDIDLYVQALGTVTPVRTVTVYSQITGQVVAVRFHEGEIVKKGAALIDIDPRPYESMLTQAEGNLEHDEGLLAEARMDLERYQAAFARNAIAKQQLDDQAQTVAQDEGSVKADRGTVAYDRVQLAYCHIVAPVTGRVGLRLVDPGNTVFAGSSTTLVVITQLQPTTVVFNVSEDDVPDVQTQLGAHHTLTVDAFDRTHAHLLDSGTLTALDNQIDTTTGTLRFRAEFLNKNLTLFPNQFVNARLRVQTLQQAILVPSAAVQHNGASAFVYVVKPDSTVAVQPVTVVTSEENVTAVTGLAASVRVATSGFDRLEGGAQVNIRNPAAPAAPPSGPGTPPPQTPAPAAAGARGPA